MAIGVCVSVNKPCFYSMFVFMLMFRLECFLVCPSINSFSHILPCRQSTMVDDLTNNDSLLCCNRRYINALLCNYRRDFYFNT